MELSTRLIAIAGLVERGAVVADIGTDHGYVPIYLVRNGIANYAYAMDINEGPLKKAKANIKASNLENKIETRLSDGLEKLSVNEADTLIIAGMGGMLISNILRKHEVVASSLKHMILSPHLDSDIVRVTLHQLGFRIEEEVLIKEDGKYYPIISAKIGVEAYDTAYYYKYGKVLIENRSVLLKEFLEQRKAQNKNILQGLKDRQSKSATARKQQINEELLELEVVLKQL